MNALCLFAVALSLATPPEPGVTVTGTGSGAEAARTFLGKHGIPVVANAAVRAIFGDAAAAVGDAELKDLLERGGVLLDDSAAALIAKRGFGDLVKADPDDPVVPDPRVRRRSAKQGWTVIVPTDGECRTDVVRADIELAGAVSLEPLLTDRLAANAQAKAAMEKAPPALRPVPQFAGAYSWWMQSFLYKRAEAAWVKDRAKVVFCGDSITQLFGGEVWDESFGSGKYMAVNCGISGDRTEHLLYRLMNGALANTNPKAAVLLIGVNNIYGRPDEPVETTVDAIWQCVARIRTAQPKGSKLVLNAIFPCGAKPDDPHRIRAAQVNAALKARLAKLDAESRGNILWLDMTDDFLAPDGTLPKELFPDSLHPSPAGYRKWSARLKPLLDQAL